MLKRTFDLAASIVGLFCLAPLMMLVAIAVKLDSAGPVFFRQERVGLRGRIFRIHKFRTMVAGAEKRGGQLTVEGDARITKVGRFLRRYKLDELAQLLDVLQGTMSLVGPRPEVPRYLAYYPADVKGILLSVRPGITDWASIHYRDENGILARTDDPQRTYVEEILPRKLAYGVEYVRRRSFAGDLKLIVLTLAAVWRKP